MKHSISIYCNDRKSYSLKKFKTKRDKLHLEPVGIHIKTDIVDCIMGLDEWEAPWCKGKNCDELIGSQLTESQALQITSGYDSTKAIVDKLSEGSAAKMCWDYNKGDLQWYLPCLNELCAMSTYIDEINDLLSHLQELGYKASSIKNTYYWSSSEHSKVGAWRVHAPNGYVYPWDLKYYAFIVHPFALP